MQIGQVFRYGRPYGPEPQKRDGFLNYFYATFTASANLPLLDSGINPIAEITDISGQTRVPAILIGSSPHKIGSFETPWQDFFDSDNGHIRYHGDNKEPGRDPGTSNGNRILLEQFKLYKSQEKKLRKLATPLIFFKRVPMNGKFKGYVQFHGFGIIDKIELITQLDVKSNRYFPNYVFDFTVFNMAGENEIFNWSWISTRRDPSFTVDETYEKSPDTWKKWVEQGPDIVNSIRRRVSKLLIVKKYEQVPVKGSLEYRTLHEIYNYFSTNKAKKQRFEALAAIVAGRILSQNGGRYYDGWITRATSDGGADFIGRLDVGSSDLASAKLIILGQAKCENPNNPTNGEHIARTVARLKRGWIGVYVTTSFFSDSVQQEIIEDSYPIVPINGLKLAQEVLSIVYERGYPSVQAFLERVDSTYTQKVQTRRPEEILFEW